MASDKIIMLTWQEHRRTRSMCAYFDFSLVELTCIERGVARYRKLLARTFSTLKLRKPRVVIVQNPSLILSIWCGWLKFVFNFKLVVDAHNEAVEPVVHNTAIIRFLTKLAIRQADLVIVTNTHLQRKVEELGSNTFVLPDRLPRTTQSAKTYLDASSAVTAAVISTAAPDEPLEIIIEAATQMPDVVFKVTGNARDFNKRYGDEFSSNVDLTGFLSDNDYWELLGDAALVIDLTTMPDCLVCGAYEAAAMGTPMILSKNRATQELFGEASNLIDNTAPQLIRAVRDILRHRNARVIAVRAFAKSYRSKWNLKAEELANVLGDLATR